MLLTLFLLILFSVRVTCKAGVTVVLVTTYLIMIIVCFVLLVTGETRKN